MNEIVSAVHNVEQWAKVCLVELPRLLKTLPMTHLRRTQPERPKVEFQFKILKPTIYKDPKGVALIIGTWNYHLSLTLGPLVGAIAAG